MSEYTPTTAEIQEGWAEFAGFELPAAEADSRFTRWLAEVERSAAERTLLKAAEELAALDDGGKRGVKEHSKSAASAAAHRNAVDVVRNLAAAYRKTDGGKTE